MTGNAGVLTAKLQPPRIGSSLVERPRLLSAFSGFAARKLTLVSAPAGYGKTVLLVQFASSASCPVAWYQVDRFDNDLAVFVEYLVAGISRHRTGFGSQTLQIAGRSTDLSKDIRRLVSSLIGEMEAFFDTGLVVVLDDYHEIDDPAVHGFVESLLQYLPRGVHLVIGSRTRPPFALARLKMEGSVAEVGQSELRLTSEEISGVLSGEQGDAVSLEDAVAVERETQGWAAAIRLTEISMKRRDRQEGPSGLTTRRDIYDYLASEVYGHLSGDEKWFLAATSVLDVVTPARCDRLLNRKDSALLLHDFASRNLFVTPLEGEDDAYRYHALFRDFLQTQLGDRRGEVVKSAASVLLEGGDQRKAVECCLDAEDYETAVGLVAEAGKSLLRYGHRSTMKRWIDTIPMRYKYKNAWLMLYEGALQIYDTNLDRAEALLEHALERFRSTGDAKGEAQVLIQQAAVLRSRGQYRDSLKLLDDATGILGPQTLDLDASLMRANNLFLQGDFEASIKSLQDRLAMAQREGDSYIAGRMFEELSEAYYVTGDYAKAIEMHQRSVELLPESPYDNSIATIYCEWGDLDQALDYANECMRIRERIGFKEVLPYGYWQVGNALMYRGDLAAAEERYQKALEFSRVQKGQKFLQALTLSFLTRCQALAGRLDEAVSTAEEAVAVAEGMSPYILGICRVALASVLVLSGQEQRGAAMIGDCATLFEMMGAKVPLTRCLGLLSSLYMRWGDRSRALDLARRAFRLAAAENYLQMFITFYGLYKEAVTLAMEEGVETSFVQEVLSRLGERALPALSALASHHDPAVRKRSVRPLTHVGSANATRLLEKLLRDRDESVSEEALAAMRAKTPSMIPSPSGRTVLTGVPLTAPMRASCLGPFRVFALQRDGSEIEIQWRTTKARDILAYLLHRSGGPVARERVLEDLWPEVDEEQASTLFHTSLYQLRKALREATGSSEAVTYAGGYYRLANNLVDTDKSRMERLLEANRGSAVAAEERASLEEFIALYQGDYLENLDYSWVLAERERLSVIHLDSAGRLARKYLEDREFPRASSLLRLILQRNPLLEDVHCLLMRAYAGMGDRLAVMQQYETLREVLDNELGVDPSPETRKLYYELCGERK